MHKLFTFLCFFLLLGLSAQSQISHGGQPYDWNSKTPAVSEYVRMPAPDLEVLRAEDKELDRHKDIPYRFGANISVDLSTENSGSWKVLENGDRVWRLGIEAKGAQTINFEFDNFTLPKGAKVFVFGADKKRFLGSFTAENANAEKALGVGFVFEDRVVISYYEPAEVQGQGYLHIHQVTHGYRNPFMQIDGLEKTGDFGQSGPCNINVNCPEGLPYGIQKQSVALIIVNGNAHCSGALINNTANDQTPYFLTANHCIGSGNPGTWVFYFNYETPGCSNDGVIPLQSISGATLKAKHPNSDFGLLLLNNSVPGEYNPCFSGWDITDDEGLVTSAYGIHHPAGDIKKICFENDAPYHQTLGGFANEVWYINQWELGVTEGGSSGSPLFNQSGRIIGQLAGGSAYCTGTTNNGGYDFYGRIGVSWDYGPTPETRLKDWLDPLNTGQVFMFNSCQESIYANDAMLGTVQNVDNTYCSATVWHPEISVMNTGTDPITSLKLNLLFNNNAVEELNWNGTIDPNFSEILELGAFSPQSGINTLSVEIALVNGEADPNEEANISSIQSLVFDGSQTVNLHLNFDNYASETSWKIKDANDYVIYSGGGYSDGDNQTNTSLCLGIGCYTFEIYDQYGDGICCEYGNGSYFLADAEGDTLAYGGDFDEVELTDFCITTVGVDDIQRDDVVLYPNPAAAYTRISFGVLASAVESIQVVDALGRIVFSQKQTMNNNSDFELNTSGFDEGVYFIVVKTEAGRITRRLVVMR